MEQFFKFISRFLIYITISVIFSSPATAAEFPKLSVFIDADKDFVTKVGGPAKTQKFINELIAKVDALYRKELGITVVLSGVHLWDSDDSFNRTTQSTLLASFAAYGESNYRSIYTYDVAHLLVGASLGGEGGIAYQGSACGDPSSAPYAYGLSQPDLTDTYEFNTHLFGHEVGHNLNAEHDLLPSCAVKTVMCQAQIGGLFSSDSKNSIASYVTNQQSRGCFTTIEKQDPTTTVKLKLSINKANVNYKVTGAQNCTTLTLVGSPTKVGLSTIFGYLQLGKVTPTSTVNAISKNVLALRGSSKIYIGAYCDGQLTRAIARLDSKKIISRRVTTSAVLSLRSLQKNFKRVSG
jgi:hypothetical protein